MTASRRLAAEALGTGLLLAAIVGSGVMGERLSGGDAAQALLANTLATGAVLVAVLLAFEPISGAHLNPAVTLAAACGARLPWRDAVAYCGAQLAGALAGVALANLMFELPVFSLSQRVRGGGAQLLGELVATFGLLSVIFGCASRPARVPFAVGAYITAAYWFTSSTSFANPAVTIARAASDSFAGIRPLDVPAFVAAQLLGASGAAALWRWLVPAPPKDAS